MAEQRFRKPQVKSSTLFTGSTLERKEGPQLKLRALFMGWVELHWVFRPYPAASASSGVSYGCSESPLAENHGCSIASSGHRNSKPASRAYFLSRSSLSPMW